jgi:hypothetical protein
MVQYLTCIKVLTWGVDQGPVSNLYQGINLKS